MKWLRYSAPLIVLLTAWETSAVFWPEFSFFYGRPSSIALDAVADFRSGALVRDFGITASEAILGFLIGSALGLAVSVLFSLSRMVASSARPYLVFLGAIPVAALAPLTILWFGAGYWSKVGVAALSTVIFATAESLRAISDGDREYLELAKTYGASKWRTYRYLSLPMALTAIIASWRTNIALAVIGAFVGEFIASEYGLGRYILKASALYDAPRVLLGVILIGVLALLLNGIVDQIELMLQPWRKNE